MIKAPLRAAGRVAVVAVAADAAAKVAGVAFRPALAVGNTGLRAIADLARPPRATGWLDDVDDAAERYRLAARQYGLDDPAKLLRGLWWRWAAFVLLSAVVFAWGVLTAPSWGAAWGGWAKAAPFVLLPAWLALATQAAFFHWQVRTRRLGRIGEWLRSPGEWVPPSDPADGRALASWLVVAAAALASLPSAAWAAATTGTASSDLALNIINGLLPLSGTGFATTGLGVVLGVLASVMTGVGTWLVTYGVVVGVVNTAHEGRVLGQRFHQIWFPIKIVVGMGLLTPLSPLAGFSGAHILLYEAAVGVNTLTNSMWSAYVGQMLGATQAAATAPGIPPSVGGSTVAEEALRAAVCATVVTDAATTAGVTSPSSAAAAGGQFVATPARRGQTADGSGSQVWSWGGPCGGLVLPVPASSAPSPMIAFSTARIGAVQAVVQAVQDSGLAAQIAGWQTGTPAGQAFPTGVLTVLTQAGQAYDATMTQAAATLAADQNSAARSKLTAAAAAGGWMQAFSYDRALGQAAGQTAQLASEAPAWTKPRGGVDTRHPGATGGVGKDTIAAVNAALDKLTDELSTERGAGVLTAADLAAGGQADDSYLNKLLEPLDHRIASAVLDWSAADSNDPVQDLMGLGAKMSSAGEAATAASLGLSFVACNEVSKLTGACDAFNTAMSLARPIIYGCLGAGWLLQFWLPMVPWVIGLTLAIGWGLATLELVLLAPIWCLSWLKLDGQELVDRQKTGLIIGANWAMRPPLAIAAYVGVRTLIPLTYPLLSKGFALAYVGSQGGHYVGLIGTVGGVIALSVLSYQTLLRLYGGLTSIPDKIPRLLGLAGDGLDADAHASGNRAVVAATGGAAGGAGRAGGGGGGGGDRPKGPPKGGPGGAPGVRPVGGGAGDLPAGALGAGQDAGLSGGTSASTGSTGGGPREAGADSWVNQSGGFGCLDAGQQAAAATAYDNIVSGGGRKAEWASGIGLEGYVSHVQSRQAEKRGGAGMVTDYA